MQSSKSIGEVFVHQNRKTLPLGSVYLAYKDTKTEQYFAKMTKFSQQRFSPLVSEDSRYYYNLSFFNPATKSSN